MCNHWKDRSQEIYAYVMKSLMSEHGVEKKNSNISDRDEKRSPIKMRTTDSGKPVLHLDGGFFFCINSSFFLAML